MPNKKHSPHKKHKSSKQHKSKLQTQSLMQLPMQEPMQLPMQTHMISNERLHNLVNDINTTRKDLTKMQTNLPAKLMQINAKPTKPQVYAKSVSSSFSSIMHNGHTHSQGKQVVNDSTKPYVRIDEMLNGDVKHYMVPKNTIPYKPSRMITSMMKQTKHTTKHFSKKSKTTKKSKKCKK